MGHKHPLTPEQDAAFKKKRSEILATVCDRASPRELRDIRVTLDKLAHLNMTNVEIYDRNYFPPAVPHPIKKFRDMNKQVQVQKSIERTRNKFPEIFSALRDKNVIDLTQVMVNLKNMALSEEFDAKDRIKASSVLIRAAVDAEKMAMSTDKEKISIDGYVHDIDLSDVV